MSRNIKVVLFSSILFGLSVGIYDFALPYYLEAQHVTFAQMGAIFALASVIMFAVRVYLGNLSDRLGRKLFYSLSLGVSTLVNFITPVGGGLIAQASLKSLREGALFTREVMHPVVIYEDAPPRFLTYISITRGLEYLFQGAGTIIAGLLITTGFWFVFGLSGALLALASTAFILIFKEKPLPATSSQRVTWRDLVNFDVAPNLKLIGISSFIFTLGLSASHSFIMPLFFSEKFGVDKPTVATILMIHRFTLAVPMLLAGLIPRRWFKIAYIVPLIIEGSIISASAVLPNFYAAAGVWLTHDLIGASFWVPVQNAIIQEYSRSDTRGSDVSKTLALGAIGGISGPFLAGGLASINISAPYFISGLIVVVSILPLTRLRLQPITPVETTTPVIEEPAAVDT
jgi:MFS family permease